MPYSTKCSTPLSNFEAGQNYKDVSDPECVVKFPIIGDADGACFLAWTTTPWYALCPNVCVDSMFKLPFCPCIKHDSILRAT